MATLYIKNMVCNRCVTAVSQVLEEVGLHPQKVSLGEVVLEGDSIHPETLHQLDESLKSIGFERIDDRKARLIEGVKNKIIRMIHHSDHVDRKYNWSKILADEMHYEYNYLSNLFSSVEGITLEQYIIRQKIEKAKELLFYDELTLSEIANRLGYSSVAHLSGQFKKITGMTPSDLKKSHALEKVRKPIDSITD
jgi:YesN/AraC family two-component response regulator